MGERSQHCEHRLVTRLGATMCQPMRISASSSTMQSDRGIHIRMNECSEEQRARVYTTAGGEDEFAPSPCRRPFAVAWRPDGAGALR